MVKFYVYSLLLLTFVVFFFTSSISNLFQFSFSLSSLFFFTQFFYICVSLLFAHTLQCTLIYGNSKSSWVKSRIESKWINEKRTSITQCITVAWRVSCLHSRKNTNVSNNIVQIEFIWGWFFSISNRFHAREKALLRKTKQKQATKKKLYFIYGNVTISDITFKY